jgi:hypothetical protein
MKRYYGYESEDIVSDIMTINDRDDDLIIVEEPLSDIEPIPLLKIYPKKTTSLFDDYGFFSESRKCYVYMEMICIFFISAGDMAQIEMFLLQLDEELIAVFEDDRSIFLVHIQFETLIKKCASSYKIELEFILY